MANLANLIVRGISRLGNVFASKVTADSFVGTATRTEFIRGTQTAATGAWTGVTEDDELYDGKEILYFLPFAGSGNATLNLTLANGSTTGAKNCYLSSTTRLTTHYGQYSLIRMTYHKAHVIGSTTYEGWWTEPGRDTNDNTTWQLRYYAAVKAETAVTADHVIVGTSAGYKNVASGVTFDITYPILWADTAISAGSTRTDTYEALQSVNLATTKSGWTGTQYSEVYLVLSALAGDTATIDDAVFTTAQPTSVDNKFYIPLGLMLSTTNCIFHAQHRIMAYVNGAFQAISSAATWAANAASAADADTVSGHTVGIDVPSDAEFTDTWNANTATAAGYVAAPGSNAANRIWKTTSTGAPTWQDTYGTCGVSASTQTKTATCTGFALTTGATVHIKMTNVNTASNPALNVNSTGAKPIRLYGTVPPNPKVSPWTPNSVVTFTYDGAAWIINGWQMSDNDKVKNGEAITGAANCTAETIIVGTSAGYKTAASGVSFDPSYPILWTESNIGTSGGMVSTYFRYSGIDLSKTKSGFSAAAKAVIYLVCVQNGSLLTIHSDVITDTPPTSESEKIYIPIGIMDIFAGSTCTFSPQDKMFRYINGTFQEYVPSTSICTSVSVPAASWAQSDSIWSQTVNVTGIVAGMLCEPILGLTHPSGVTQADWENQIAAWSTFAESGWAETGAGTITLSCYSQPAYDFTMSVQCHGL